MTEMEHSTPGDTTQHSSRRGGNIRIKLIYIIVLALILVICATQALLQLTNSISATIRINSLYSADGKNPDGSPFSIMDLMCDDVMECAAQKLDGKLTAEEIRSHLTISDTMSGNSFTRLEESIYNSENENTYFPTEYLITYSTITQQTREEGFLAQCKCLLDSFSQPSHTEILNAVLRSYREYYGQMYLNHDALFEIDWEEVDSMDYYNRFEFLDNTVERLRRFLQYRNDRTLSQFNGSYTDLIAELTQGPAQDIESFQAYVTQNGITNNKDVLLRQFVYAEKNHEYVSTIITPEDHDSQIYGDVERDKDYVRDFTTYDQMMFDYVNFATESRDLLIDKAYINASLEHFSAGSSAHSAPIDEIAEIYDQYAYLMDMTAKTLDGYNAFKAGRVVMQVSGIRITETLPDMLYYTLSGIFAVCLGCGLIVVDEVKKSVLSHGEE